MVESLQSLKKRRQKILNQLTTFKGRTSGFKARLDVIDRKIRKKFKK